MLTFAVLMIQFNREATAEMDSGEYLFFLVGWIIGIVLLFGLKVLVTAYFLYKLMDFVRLTMDAC
jgi:hypothetical protein